MPTPVGPPKFFATPEAFRRWLRANHGRARELWVGFYKRASGRPSITWPESVDEALCVGWIDGVRRSIDDECYMIRFTPRRPESVWSAVNRRRMEALLAEGRVEPAGKAAFEVRRADRSGIYAYENRASAAFDDAEEAAFRAVRGAWEYFAAQPPSYRHTVTWWVRSAKRPETKARRLTQLIAHSAAGERIPGLRPAKRDEGSGRKPRVG